MAPQTAPASGAKCKQTRPVGHVGSAPAFEVEAVRILEDVRVAVGVVRHEHERVTFGDLHPGQGTVTCCQTPTSYEGRPQTLRLEQSAVECDVTVSTITLQSGLKNIRRNIRQNNLFLI